MVCRPPNRASLAEVQVAAARELVARADAAGDDEELQIESPLALL